MRFEKHLNKTFKGANQRDSLYDIYLPNLKSSNGLIVFLHGYKGFKDWGCWDKMAEYFANYQFTVLKLNFSHNGGTTANPIDFPDLEAFANNRLSYEVEDVKLAYEEASQQFDISHLPLYLMGHSRGGGIAQLITGRQVLKVDKLVLLASVSDFASRFPWDKKEWKKNKTVFVENTRTKQQLPHHYSFYQDFLDHKSELDVSKWAKKIDCETLILSGEKDLAISAEETEAIKNNIKDNESYVIAGANHVFNCNHPYEVKSMPRKFEMALKTIRDFLKQ